MAGSRLVAFIHPSERFLFNGDDTMPKMGKAKQAMRDRAREILAGLNPGDRITDPKDFLFIRALLERHPSKDQKIGVGVNGFTSLRPDGKSKCFAVVRVDGTFDTFSIKTCIEPSTARSDLQGGFRTVVIPQCDNVWVRYRETTPVEQRKCPVSGELITDDNFAVGHHPDTRFGDLVDRFLAERGIELATIQLERHPHWDKRWWPSDSDLRDDFERYHRDHAKLRVLSKEGNAEEERVWHRTRMRISPVPSIETATQEVTEELGCDRSGATYRSNFQNASGHMPNALAEEVESGQFRFPF